MNYYIGIDIGTSGTKSVLFDASGNVVASSSYEYNIISLKPGYAEEDPTKWWEAVLFTLNELKQYHNGNVCGIGVSGQMHGLVILDENNEVIRNSIIWCDTRTEEEKEFILSKFSNDELKDITGNHCMSAFTLAKLLWVKRNEEDNYKKIAHVMLPKDYIVYKLTGKFSADYSDSSGTQWLNIKTLDYATKILDTFELDRNWFSKLYESTDIVGKLESNLAKNLNLEKCVVCAGGGDQACGAVGCGIVTPNDMSVVLGSSGVVFAPTKELFVAPNAEVQTFCHAMKGQYHVMGVTNACGTSLKWYKNTIDNKSYDELMADASLSKAGANGVIYLPYLLGERTPHLDNYATGMFFGLRNTTTKNDLARAVIEGVGYSLKDCFNMLEDKEKTNVVISGGGAKSALWREIIASMLGVDVRTIKSDEGPCLGAAIMAMVACNEYSDIVSACQKIVGYNEISKVNLDFKKVYDEKYLIYKQLYLNNKEIFKKMKED